MVLGALRCVFFVPRHTFLEGDGGWGCSLCLRIVITRCQCRQGMWIREPGPTYLDFAPGGPAGGNLQLSLGAVFT